MKLKKSDPAVIKTKQGRQTELESRRQDTQNSQNVQEWRDSVEARLKAIEDKIFS